MPRDDAPDPNACPWTIWDVVIGGVLVLFGVLIMAANPPIFTIALLAR